MNCNIKNSILRSAQEDVTEEPSMEVVEENIQTHKQIDQKKLEKRKSYAYQLNNPEWLIDPPMDLLLGIIINNRKK